ncbi:LysR family transcriptional regulator [Microvirga sp. VF16]|uniref:LysR family transcriptional regulator n=1 Tax=Microvirga sp. VF16 TaxID=2807101 RepID=UPI00193D79D7|nr:LysR family transcriptional regulator [Microvirga sp. VF16]QRM32667.1 LysR family transcriptional regulator [Microvirga sp. VF16]
MNIRFLQTVVWLSELRSFRVTADRMNITPAAISSRIAAIEQELGIRLFERDSRDVRLTDEGRTFVSGARDIIARYNNLVSEVIPQKTVEGTVRIGVLPSMALTILPGIMETLRNQFPRIRVSITTDTSRMILGKLQQRELDVVLGFHEPHEDQYRVVNLCTFGMFWIADRRLQTHDDILTKEDLLLHPIISYAIGTHNHRRLVEYMSQRRLEECVIHYSDSLTTTISMVAAGIGISILPPIVIQDELRSGNLKVLNVNQDFPSTDYFAVYLENPSSRLSPLIASIAADVAADYCALYDNAIASRY